jgi:hypothetical protein
MDEIVKDDSKLISGSLDSKTWADMVEEEQPETNDHLNVQLEVESENNENTNSQDILVDSNVTPKGPCLFFMRGLCVFGEKCLFSHEESSSIKNEIPLCPYYLVGKCKYGESCLYRHDKVRPRSQNKYRNKTNIQTSSNEWTTKIDKSESRMKNHNKNNSQYQHNYQHTNKNNKQNNSKNNINTTKNRPSSKLSHQKPPPKKSVSVGICNNCGEYLIDETQCKICNGLVD